MKIFYAPLWVCYIDSFKNSYCSMYFHSHQLIFTSGSIMPPTHFVDSLGYPQSQKYSVGSSSSSLSLSPPATKFNDDNESRTTISSASQQPLLRLHIDQMARMYAHRSDGIIFFSAYSKSFFIVLKKWSCEQGYRC